MQQRRVWWHFALVLAILVMYRVFVHLAGYRELVAPAVIDWSGVAYAVLLDLPGIVIGAMAWAAAIALAVLELRPGALGTAALLLCVTFGVMTLYDVWGEPAMKAVNRRVARSEPPWPILADSSAVTLRDTTGDLQRAVALASGRVRITDLQPHWPPPAGESPGFRHVRDPRVFFRLEWTSIITDLLDLTFPLLLGGLVVGATSWLTLRVTFRSPRDGRILRIVAAWMIVIGISGVLYAWMRDYNYGVVSGHIPLAWLFVPAVPVVVLSALGWRSAARTCRTIALER